MNYNFTHLRMCTHSLKNCPSSVPVPCPTLDYGPCWMRSAFVWEESFPSQYAAAQSAAKTFQNIYLQAEEWLRRYTDPERPDSWFGVFRHRLNQHLDNLRDTLLPMRTPHTAPVLNRIAPLLTPDKILCSLEASIPALRDAYALPSPGDYLRHTEYSTYDASEGEAGITWLLGKLLIRHGYDLTPAIHILEDDFRRNATGYYQACALQAEQALQHHLITPLQTLLPILYQVSSTQNT